MSRKKKQLVILTGLSGSGKSMAFNTFEDLDFYCIDNLPPRLIPETVALWAPPREPQDVAIVADVRGGQFFDELTEVCRQL
ncbi:MAG: RNase adapter RapZ, partial [Armatimonadota bacterium]